MVLKCYYSHVMWNVGGKSMVETCGHCPAVKLQPDQYGTEFCQQAQKKVSSSERACIIPTLQDALRDIRDNYDHEDRETGNHVSCSCRVCIASIALAMLRR